jgi:glycolate oxidase FAD binding subunit
MTRPDSEAELAELIRATNAPLSIHGGGTRGFSVDGAPLDTTGLHGINLYEPGALTMVVGAGTPLQEIDTILAEKGQRLAFEPMDHRTLLGTQGEPTIGGIAAANISGPRRLQAGAARDHMLGVRFVSGTGEVIKNGGRVMKNVTGYDLVKLMAGSYGTLGVLTEVSLKVQAIPQAEATLVLRGQTIGDAIADLSRAMGTPFDVSGAAYVGMEIVENAALRLIRVEGMAGSVAYRAERLKDLLGADEVLEDEASRELWARIRDVRDFAPDRADRDGNTDNAIWRISVAPSAAPAIHSALVEARLTHAAVCDWSGGLIWLRTPLTGDAGAQVIRDVIGRHGGHATLIRGKTALSQDVPVFHPQTAVLEKIAAGLRQKFDPKGILNAGLMG